MNIERLVQISLALLTSLSAMTVSVEDDLTLPLVTLIVSLSSIYLTDVKGWIDLKPRWANLIGLLVCGAALWRFWDKAADVLLVSMTYVLFYLSYIVFFRKKRPALYWYLISMTVVEVTVGSVLYERPLFGGYLTLYLLCGLWTLSMLYLFRHGMVYRGDSLQGLVGNAPSNEHLAPASERAGRSSPTVFYFNTPPENPARQVLSWRYARTILGFSVGILCMTAIIFTIMPRVRRSSFSSLERPRGMRAIGFTEQVTLGRMGAVRDNPTGVFRIRFSEVGSDQTYLLEDDLLIRGGVLTRYSEGKWDKIMGPIKPLPRRTDLSEDRLVKQEITSESSPRNLLFCLQPAINIQDGVELHFDSVRDQIIRPAGQTGKITLLTSGLRDGRQLPIVPLSPRDPRELSSLLQVSNDALKIRLKTYGDEILSRFPPQDRAGKANILEKHLSDSGEFEYSLVQAQPVPTGTDPVEDFVFTTRKGHCEYFASALALMLRSQDIPCRVAVGFKGGDWNDYGEYYNFRQSHAHAWVEVFLEKHQIPAEDLARFADEDWEHGGLLRLDPTAGISTSMDGDSLFSMMTLRELSDYGRYLWSVYVVQMDASSQAEKIYMPLVRAVLGLFDPQAWKLGLTALAEFLGFQSGKGFQWRTVFGVLFLGAFCYALFRSLRWGKERLKTFHGKIKKHRFGKPATVEFFRRFEKLLRRHAIPLAPGETARELALLAGNRLPRSDSSARHDGPSLIAEAYYRVRFGRHSLDKEELQAVENALADLERGLASQKGR